MIVLAAACALVQGAAMLSLLRIRLRTGGGLLGAAFFLGVLGLALWTNLLLIVRVPFSIWTLAAGPAVLAGLAAWKGGRDRVDWPRPTLWLLPSAAGVFFLFAGALSSDLLGFDPELFYVLKAKSILHYGTIWNPDFLEPHRVHLAARRPLLLPAIYADFFLLADTTDHRMLRVWFVLLHVGGIAWLADRFRPHPLWLAVLVWLPAYRHDAGGAFSAYADPVLGVLFLLAVHAVLRREWALASVALAAAVLLKYDSFAFVLALAIATAIARLRDLPRTALALAAPVTLAIAWAAVSWSFASTGDVRMEQFTPSALLASVSNWPLVLARFASEFVRAKHWGIFWLLFAASFVLHARRLDRDDFRWLGTMLLYWLACVAVIATAFPSREATLWAMRVQGMRLLLALVPLAWAWMALKWNALVAAQPAEDLGDLRTE